MHTHYQWAVVLPLALSTILIVPPVTAQDETQRPIRMVVGVAAGGSTDMLARLVARNLADRIGQQVIVDNRPGASGIVGSDIVARSQPDGHTLLMANSAHATYSSLYSKVPFDAVKDFAPISLVARSQSALVVHPTLPVKSVSDLIRYAGQKPGTLNVAGGAIGTAQHLGWERFKRMTNTDIVYIPYQGTGALMPDLFSGRLHAVLGNVLVMIPHVKSGKLRGLGVTGANRSPALPDIPTIAEAGVPGFQAISWYGIFAAANTPPAAVKRLSEAIAASMRQPDVVARLSSQGAEALSDGPASLKSLLTEEITVWGKIIRDAGIRLD